MLIFNGGHLQDTINTMISFTSLLLFILDVCFTIISPLDHGSMLLSFVSLSS